MTDVLEPASPSPLLVSPSRLARFFFLECERMLRYSATPAGRRAADEVPPRDRERPSPVTAALVEEGYRWEEQVVESLGPAVLRGPPAESGALHDCVTPYEDAVRFFAGKAEQGWLYQAELRPPRTFYARFGLDPERIVFTPCRPDLVQLRLDGDRPTLWVVDVKATDTLRLSHRVQAALYALLIRDILVEHGIEGVDVDAASCGIWLHGRPAPDPVDLRALLRPLEAFLRHDLPRILVDQPAAQAAWALNFRCEWCDYFEHCRAEASEREDVSLIAYLAPEAKRFLEQQAPPVTTLGELEAFLGQEDAAERLRGCAPLVGRRERLAREVSALRQGAVVETGGTSLALPPGQRVGIVFTLQRDPVTGGLFAAALRVRGGGPIAEDVRCAWQEVAAAPTPEALGALRREFVGRLEQVLRRVHDHNAATTEAGERLSLQTYVFDGYERDLLDQLLLESLQQDPPDVVEQALTIFFHFQSEQLASGDAHPDRGDRAGVTPFPVVVVTRAVRDLACLPIPVAYRLAEVSELVRPEQYASVYRARDRFTFPLSNRLRSDVVFEAWRDGDAGRLASVRQELDRRTQACFSVISGLIDRTRERLVARAPTFSLPQRLQLVSPELSRLAFVARYEQVLAYLEVRAARARPRSERLEAGTALRLRLLAAEGEPRRGETRWRAALAPESRHVLPEPTILWSRLVTPDDEEGDREQMRFDDYRYHDSHWVPRGAAVAFAEVVEVEADRRHVLLAVRAGARSRPLAPGDHVVVQPRFVDWNTRRVLAALAELDPLTPCAFVDLLRDPDSQLRPREAPGSLATPAGRAAALAAFGFTASQGAAFSRILEQSFQLVWGPPGTGKTHFLGLLVGALAGACAESGRGLRVLVSGFTHTAIENCLRKIVELAARHAARVPALRVVKLGGWRGNARPDEVVELDAGDPFEGAPDGEVVVVGATVYAIQKNQLAACELVIVDEGSQLRVAEAAIPISRVTEGGRLVIAGDDLQLGPILHGRYPPPADGQPAIFGSIFECLRARDRGRDLFTAQLLECFRMNATLCRFPADALYGSGFRPVDEATRDRRVRLRPPGAPEPDWLELVLAPAYPLVLVTLRGVPALAENRVEAGLAAAAVLALRDRLEDPGTAAPYDDDGAFWSRGVFVVSPHHVQIRAIVDALETGRGWTDAPLVGTVDTMQGRESQVVVVSYGVADADYARREAEFIYSLQRLNVSTTRGQAKAIVFLPEPLLRPPVSAFARDDLLAGVDFMLRLERFALERGDVHELAHVPGLPPGGSLRLARVGVPTT